MLIDRYYRIVWQPSDGGGGAAAPAAEPAAAPAAEPAAAPAAEPAAAPAAEPAAVPAAKLDETVLDKTLLDGGPEKPAEGDTPGADTKEGEPSAPEIKPEDYNVELPEGIGKDDPLLVSFLEGAAKGGMDNESVQAVINTLGPKLVEQMQAPIKAWVDLNEKWVAEVQADPVIGGDKWPMAKETVLQAMTLVLTPEETRATREALGLTGAGNNPAVIRLLYSMARRLVEPGPVKGNAPTEPPKSAAALLYPKHNNAAKGG
jgi:hypothetical protein